MLSRRSFFRRTSAAVLVSCASLPTLLADEPRPMAGRSNKPLAVPTTPSAAFLETIDAKHRDAVSAVMRSPTITSKSAEDSFFAQPGIYDYFLDHPDRASLAWRRLSVPCVEIKDRGNGTFFYQDDKGSEIVWQAVAKFSDGVVWYATGTVKAAAMLPVVPVKAVAVLKCPRSTVDARGETATFEPTIAVYLQTDSKATAAVLRVIGPAAPRMAEQGAEQLLLFFSGPARYIFEHPEQAAKLIAPPSASTPARR